jgi:N-acetylneuraminic acid mutarotase
MRIKDLIAMVLLGGLMSGLNAAEWLQLDPETLPTKRHEAAFTELDGKFYLLGGRGIKAVDVYDPETNLWEKKANTPIELHHFQALSYGGKLYVIGAFTGPYPNETPVPSFHIYDPASDKWSIGASIPPGRRRGSAGVVVHDGSFYLVCGIVHGHQGDFVPWLDRYDPATGKWTVLPDAPHSRDHYQAVVLDGKIVAAGGRTSSGWTKQVFDLTVPAVDVYDIATGEWQVLEESIPTPRAGCFATVVKNWVVVAGGESGTQREAHDEVEALDIRSGHWKALSRLITGRHGTGLAYWRGALYTASGCARRGGSPEQDSTEMLSVKDLQ